MKLFPQVYRLFNLLSLDISIGAICMAYFISIVLNVQASFVYYILLGQVVWVVYLSDHLYDSRKKEGESYRRKFYKKYATLLLYVLIANVLSITVLFLLNYNIEIIQWSLPACFITCIYLLANWRYQFIKKSFYLKELFIAVGYTWGVMTIPLSFLQSFNNQIWLLGSMVLCMALWNVLIIAVFEKKLNDVEGQTTISQWMTVKQIKFTTTIIYLIFFILAILNFIWYQIPTDRFIMWIGIGIYMAIPFIIPGFMKMNERYNKWAELVFLLPTVYFIWVYLYSLSV